MRRVGAAVVTGRADASAIGRGAIATLVGALVAVVVLGSVAVYAVLRPTPDAGWRRGNAVIVESETGDHYVYLDGTLRPVLNYASARLILGSATAPVVVASHASLAPAAHGAPVGIVGAPDVLPAAGSLDSSPWAVCSAGATDVLVVGSAAGPAGSRGFAGGGSLSGGRPLGSRAIVVQGGDGTDYLLAGRRRDRILDRAAVFRAAGWSDVSPVRVGRALVDAVAAGPEIDVSDMLDPVPTVERVESQATLCAQVSADGTVAQIIVGASIRIGPRAPTPPTARSGRDASVGAATVVVSAGRGLLVRSLASPSGFLSLCLLTDAGTCFPIADAATLSSLGYASAQVVTMPDSVVALLPKGPVLSRTAASRSG